MGAGEDEIESAFPGSFRQQRQQRFQAPVEVQGHLLHQGAPRAGLVPELRHRSGEDADDLERARFAGVFALDQLGGQVELRVLRIRGGAVEGHEVARLGGVVGRASGGAGRWAAR